MECGDLPPMPMKAIYENSLEYVWSQKKVFESKLLSDMETIDAWEHQGDFGSLTLRIKNRIRENMPFCWNLPLRDRILLAENSRTLFL